MFSVGNMGFIIFWRGLKNLRWSKFWCVGGVGSAGPFELEVGQKSGGGLNVLLLNHNL